MKLLKTLLIVSSLFFTSLSFGNEWPNKPVKLVVTFPAGGGTDIMARALAKELSTIWNQPVVVENKPGGQTIVGVSYVLAQPADGTTIGIVHTGITNSFAWNTKLPYTFDSITPVAIIATNNQQFVVRSNFPANTLAELIEYARKNPGKVSYGSVGNGTLTHFALVLLQEKTGVNIVHIPYKGTAPSLVDLGGGHIDMIGDSYSSSKGLLQSGKGKALANLGKERVLDGKTYPLASDTVPGLVVTSYFGTFVPAGTPKAIVDKINQGVNQAVASPGFKQFMKENALDGAKMTPAQFDAFLKSEIKRWSKVIKDNNVQME